MGTYPTKPREAFLNWCLDHEDPFTSHAVAIGLTVAQATAFKTVANAAADAAEAQRVAKQAAETATQVMLTAFRDLRTSAGDTVRLIRAFGEQQANPDAVYALAQIPPPAAPAPTPPPGLPFDFRVGLTQDGEIELSWKCTNPVGASGTVYLVERKVNGAGSFSFLGAAGGDKHFTDSTVPAGANQIEYRVTGQRSGVSGPSAIWTVRFGLGGGGLTITESFAGNPSANDGAVKMAA
jgi:hypothetical protein